MKVTFLGALPPIIGVSPYCMHISYALSKKIDLDFIGFKKFSQMSKSFSRETEINEQIYHNILKNIKTKKTLNWYNPISGLIAGIRLKTDILHVQWWIPTQIFVYLPIIICAKIKKIRIIISLHNILPHIQNRKDLLFDKIVNKFVFPFADRFIVHNQRNKETFIQFYKIDENKISIITHGVLDLAKQKEIPMNEAKAKLQLPTDKKIILFFGYLRKNKGVDVLIKAFNKINKEMEDVFLLIAGQPFRVDINEYMYLIKNYNLEATVKFEPGFVPEDDIGYYFSACDLVVLPYTYLDTHGGVGALALPYKKPMIVSDVGGLPEYVKDDRAIVEPNNVQDLSEKIIKILKNQDLQYKLSEDSKYLINDLSWDKISDETIKVYQSLII